MRQGWKPAGRRRLRLRSRQPDRAERQGDAKKVLALRFLLRLESTRCLLIASNGKMSRDAGIAAGAMLAANCALESRMRLSEERLSEIVGELSTKPRHDKVKAAIQDLLVDGLSVPSAGMSPSSSLFPRRTVGSMPFSGVQRSR
jgi:hypothetical protein